MPPRKMVSQVVDLSAESSDVEPNHQKPSEEQSKTGPKGSKSQQPLEDSKNIARNVQQPEFDKHRFEGALKAAVSSLSVEQARYCLQLVATNSKESCALLWAELTVDGKDVVRYHEDTGSEDACGYEDEEGSEEEHGSDDGGSSRRRGERKSIVVTDNEKIARHATCKNCKQEFDVTINEKGSCVWHTGRKALYEDEDFWADHDDDCHGDPHSFEDDPDFADGFRWTCCDKPGDDEGCKSTKHKAKANMIVKDNPVAAPSKKRKAVEQNPTSVTKPMRQLRRDL